MKKIIVILLLWCLLLGVFLFYSTSNRAQIATFLKTQKEKLFPKESSTGEIKVIGTLSSEVSKEWVATDEKNEEKYPIETKVFVKWPEFVPGNPEKEENLIKHSCWKIVFKTSVRGLIPYKDTPMEINKWYEEMSTSDCKIDESVFFSDYVGKSRLSNSSWLSFHIVKEFPEIPWILWYFPTIFVENFLNNNNTQSPIFQDDKITILFHSFFGSGIVQVIKNENLGMKSIFSTIEYSPEKVYGDEWWKKYSECFGFGGSDDSQCPPLEQIQEKETLFIKRILEGDSRLQKAVQAINSFTLTR